MSQTKTNKGRVVLFFRKEGFYPVTLSARCKIEDHVRLNPGTLKVVDAETREVLWQEEKKVH